MIPLVGCGRHEDSAYGGQYPSIVDGLAIRRKEPNVLVESQARGRLVYDHYCQICHGTDALGDGFNSAMLDPPPRNFADEEFWKQTDDEHLLNVIVHGGQAAGKSKLMPSWGRTLDEQQVRDAIAFLHTVPELARQNAEAEALAEAAEELE